MTNAYQSLLRYMDEHSYTHHAEPDKERVHCNFGGKNASCRLVLQVDDLFLQAFAAPGFLVPEGARGQVAEAICRANFGLKIGRLEMDMNDGELRYHASTCLVSDDLTNEVIHLIISAAIVALDRYVPALLGCIYGNEVPEDAVRCADAFQGQ